MRKTFATDRLRLARGALTIAEWADRLEVSRWTVRRWEAGSTYPRANELAEIAALSGRSVAWFYVSRRAAS